MGHVTEKIQIDIHIYRYTYYRKRQRKSAANIKNEGKTETTTGGEKIDGRTETKERDKVGEKRKEGG